MASTPSTLRLSRESRRIAGILLLSAVAVETGGLYLTRVASGAQETTDFQASFARAGHGHAGVLIILGLLGVILADATRLAGALGHLARTAVPVAAILMPAGFFFSSMGDGVTEPNGLIALVWLGGLSLATGLVVLGGALVRSGFGPEPADGDPPRTGATTAAR